MTYGVDVRIIFPRVMPLMGEISPVDLEVFALLVSCLALSANSEAQTAVELLRQAEKLADQGDRYRAQPLYDRAEEQFRAAGDRRNELYAKFGRLHSESDHGNYKSVEAEVERDLATATVQRDPGSQNSGSGPDGRG